MNVSSDTGGKSGRIGQDFDLNLAPIIDCFTVLIAFMLASASYLAIGILDTNPSTPGQPGPNAKPPSINLEVALEPSHRIQIRISGKEKLDKALPAVKDDWDFKSLVEEVTRAKKAWPDTQTLILSATDETAYEEVIRAMDVLKPVIPNIALGGF